MLILSHLLSSFFLRFWCRENSASFAFFGVLVCSEEGASFRFYEPLSLADQVTPIFPPFAQLNSIFPTGMTHLQTVGVNKIGILRLKCFYNKKKRKRIKIIFKYSRETRIVLNKKSVLHI